MTKDEWYLVMARLIKVRDHAVKMVARWEGELVKIEHEIQTHRLRHEGAEPTATEAATEEN